MYGVVYPAISLYLFLVRYFTPPTVHTPDFINNHQARRISIAYTGDWHGGLVNSYRHILLSISFSVSVKS